MSVKVWRGKWTVDTLWPDGFRTRRHMPDKDTAGRIDLRTRASLVDGTWRQLRATLGMNKAGSGDTFSDIADLYIKDHVMLRNKAVKTKKSRVGLLKDHLGSIRMEFFRAESVNGYIAKKQKAKTTNATINRDVAVLKHLMAWARDEGYIASNPMAGFKKLPETQWEGQRPTDEAIDAVFAKLNAAVVPLFTFIRETGCRRGEALSLCHHQIDHAKREVLFVRNTKSRKPRRVPLTDEAMAAVEAMPKSPKCDYVFYRTDGKKRWAHCNKPWLEARRLAKVEWLRVHDLRHAYAIKLAEEGCPMHFIQEMLGHYSVTLTERIYGKFSPQSAANAVREYQERRKPALKAAG